MIIYDDKGIDKDEYKDILYDGLFSLIDDLLAISEDAEEIQIVKENAFVFMQDNALYHKATAIMKFLEENHISIMQWPSQSLNLNSIENLWLTFKEWFHKCFMKLFSHASKSMEVRYRYDKIMQEVWYLQGMKLVKALILFMSRHCQAVIDANGGWTKY